jgi:hypothetical protein
LTKTKDKEKLVFGYLILSGILCLSRRICLERPFDGGCLGSSVHT